MTLLELRPEWIVREGRKVIAAEVESQRAKAAATRSALKRIHNDPLWRAAC